MSYDVCMVADVGGSEPARIAYTDMNYTYNVYLMFREALGGDGLYELDGLTGEEAGAMLDKAGQDMRARPDHYRAMNPENGWGDFEGAYRFLMALLDHCNSHPRAKVSIT